MSYPIPISAIDEYGFDYFISNIANLPDKQTKSKRERLHKTNPKITFDKSTNRYYCESCGNFIKPSKLSEHKRK